MRARARAPGQNIERAAGRRRYGDFVQMRERSIHGGEILLHDRFAALAVCLLDRLL